MDRWRVARSWFPAGLFDCLEGLVGGSVDQVLEELRSLRKGRGVYALKIRAQVGPGLRAVCGIALAEASESVRVKLIDRLGGLAGSLPGDLGLAVRAGLALDPRAQQLFLGQRVQWLAEQLGRDERTARRRLDEGLLRLAEAAVGRPGGAVEGSGDPGAGWFVEAFHAVLRLDRDAPQVIEYRRIVAERDGVDEVEAMITLPREVDAASRRLLMEVVYGVSLIRTEQVSGSRFRYVLALPTPLRAGDRHEYALVFRVPPDQPMHSQYLLVSPRRCDLFDLRVRFDPSRSPAAVWRVSGVFYVGLDDLQPGGEPLALDKVGEVHQRFRDLKPGFSYGVLWKDPEQTRPGT